MTTSLARLAVTAAIFISQPPLAEELSVDVSNTTANCHAPSEQEHRICLRPELVIDGSPSIETISKNGTADIIGQRVDPEATNCYLIRTRVAPVGEDCLELFGKRICNCKGRGWIELRVTLRGDEWLGEWKLAEWKARSVERGPLAPRQDPISGVLVIDNKTGSGQYEGVLTLTLPRNKKVVERMQLTVEGVSVQAQGRVIEGSRDWTDDRLTLKRIGLSLEGVATSSPGLGGSDSVKFEKVPSS